MKRLSKDDQATRQEHVDNLNEAADAVREAVAEVNALIDSKLNPAILAYNDRASDAAAFRDEIVGQMDEYVDKRSDKWRESEAGESYEAWKNDWESLDTNELSEAELIEEPDMEFADELNELQSEPDR